MFYIKRKSDLNWDSEYSTSQLGEISFKNFWIQEGFKILKKNIEKNNLSWLEQIEIFDDQLNQYTIEEFLDKVKGFIIYEE